MKYLLTTLATIMAFGLLTVALPEIAFAGAAKVDVCHLPPGNPNNFHSITISENAEQAHLNHGDLEGDCMGNCDTLCDDADACTQDVQDQLAECSCLAAPRPPVDCDDANPCTVDSCDTVDGCGYDTEVLNGTSCDDGVVGTDNDQCTSGVCAGSPVGPSGCAASCDVASGRFLCEVTTCIDKCQLAIDDGLCAPGAPCTCCTNANNNPNSC